MSQSRQERRAAMRQMMKEMQKQHKQLGLSIDAPREPFVAAVPVSKAQLTANRANAQLSTGPVTPEGRAASSQNNFKHGLYSKQLIMKGENPAELDALKADLAAEHRPANTTEDLLLNEMAEQYWRLKRARRIEASIFSAESLVIPHINAVQRLMSSAERGFHKALKTLCELQKQRGFVPQNRECTASGPAASGGFVPQKQKIAPESVAKPAEYASAAALRGAPASALVKNSVSGTGFESQKQAEALTINELHALEAEFETIEKLLKAA